MTPYVSSLSEKTKSPKIDIDSDKDRDGIVERPDPETDPMLTMAAKVTQADPSCDPEQR